MSFELHIAAIGIAAYCLGSISFAIVVSKIRGLADPRSYGSHNPGATNVLRSGDKVAAALTLIGDASKGWLGVMLAGWWSRSQSLPQDWQTIAVAVAAFAVFLGHLFPVFFRFQGGKGVATAFGVLLALDGMVALATGLTWLAVAKLGKISSLAALCAAVVAPIATLWRSDLGVMFWSVLAIAALLVMRHKQNIENLLSGKEKSFKR